MGFSLMLHIVTCLGAMGLCQLGVNKNTLEDEYKFRWNIEYVASFLLLLFFLGYRVNLGRDWLNYLDIYNTNYEQDFNFSESFELGFLLIVNTLKSVDADFQYFIFITSLITLLLFYKSFRRCYYLLPLGIFVFFTGWAYPVAINTIRQGIAIFALMCAVSYIDDDEEWSGLKYLFFIGIGLLFHYTVLLFLPCYYIAKVKIDTKNLLIICASLYVVASFFILPLFSDLLGMLSKYEGYSTDSYHSESITFGLGATLLLVVRFVPLLVYDYIIKNWPSFTKYFVLYYLGLSVYYVFFRYLLITRITFYLQFFELIVMSIFIYILFSSEKEYKLLGAGYILLIVFNYVYTFGDFLRDQLVANDYSLFFMNLTYLVN